MAIILTLAERVLARTIRTDGCWVWQGATVRGYGTLSVGGRGDGNILAHRAMWESVNGPIPDSKPKLCVLHHCDNPPCVRPDHLFLGTRKRNNEDKVTKGRQSRGQRGKNGKVTEQMVLQIRERYAGREVITTRTTWGDPNSITALAREFGIHPTTVFDIVRRKTWKHI